MLQCCVHLTAGIEDGEDLVAPAPPSGQPSNPFWVLGCPQGGSDQQEGAVGGPCSPCPVSLPLTWVLTECSHPTSQLSPALLASLHLSPGCLPGLGGEAVSGLSLSFQLVYPCQSLSSGILRACEIDPRTSGLGMEMGRASRGTGMLGRLALENIVTS